MFGSHLEFDVNRPCVQSRKVLGEKKIEDGKLPTCLMFHPSWRRLLQFDKGSHLNRRISLKLESLYGINIRKSDVSLFRLLQNAPSVFCDPFKLFNSSNPLE